MNVGLNNNFNVSSSKQDSVKRSGENKVNTFQESMIDSFNSINENGVSSNQITKIEKNEIDFINNENLTDEDLENLEVLVYFLDLVCDENNINNKIFDFENNDRNLNLLSEKEFESSFSKKTGNQNSIYSNDSNFNKNAEMLQNKGEISLDKIDNKVLNKFLSDLGLDIPEIELKNITKGEFYKNVLDNSEKFKNIIKKEVSKFNDVIPKLLDSSGNFLDDKKLLKNIKNEINYKLSKITSKNDNNSEVNIVSDQFSDTNGKINSMKYEKFNILNKFVDEKSDDNEVLKKISGENNYDKEFETYFMDNLKNNDILNEVPVKTIEFKNPEKFVKEFIETVKYMVKENKVEMIVKINPDNLGKMDIKYEFVKDTVRVMIRAESSEALKIIENRILDIKEIIRDNNQVNLSNIDVELKQFDFNSNGHGSKHGGGKNDNKDKNNIKLEDEITVKEKGDLSSGILV